MSDMHNDMSDEKLKGRLGNFEEIPDDHVWEKIRDGLGNDAVLAHKLTHYEETPDDRAWAAVDHAIRIEKLLVRFDRLISALSVLALLLFIYYGYGPGGNLTGDPAANTHATAKLSAKPQVELNSTAEVKRVTDSRQPEEGDASAETAAAGKRHKPAREKENARSGVQRKTENDKKEPSAETLRTDPDRQLTTELKSADRVEVAQRDDKGITPSSAFIHQSLDSQEVVSSTDNLQLAPRQISSVDPVGDPPANIVVDSLVAEQAHEKEQVIPETAAAPEKDKKKKRLRDGGLYLLVMPTLGYNEIRPVRNDGIFIESIEKVSAFSPKRLGIRAEIGFEGPLSQRLRYHVGVLYFQRKQTIHYRYRDGEHFTVIPIDLQTMQYQVQPTTMSSTFDYELKNTGVIAGLNYTLKTNLFMHKVGIAAELQRSLTLSGKEQGSDAKTFLFGDLYYRVAYALSPHFDLMFQPTLNYSLQLDERVTAPFYVKPYGLGLNLGVYYHFRGR
ncbi:MAG TPA: hypothetical protein VEB86_09880 [Chryseosolibacter sp.]|nr:hypothetical protein [Chryseosolibacter sp.]